MKTTSLSLTALIFLSVFSTDTRAGAWTRSQGSAYAKLAFTTLSSDEAYDQDGNKFTTPSFSTWSVNLYGEYGIFDRLTGILRVPFLRSAGYATSESATGVGDVSVELKYGLLKGSTPVAVAVEAQLPTGDPDATGALINGTGTVPLPTGDGAHNTRIKASLSHSFHPIPGYVSVDAGYNVRAGFTDEYLFMVQAGYQIDNALWLQANVNARGPVETPDSVLASQATLGFGEGVQFIAYSVGLAYPLSEQFTVSFDMYSAFGRITSIYSGLNFIFGVALSI